MRRIAVINQKGGVGKTTTTVHLGAALAVMGKRVLLIDLDPQAHLTLHFGVETSDERGSVYDVLTASAPIPDVALHARENVTIVPSDIDLAAAEAELISVPGREVLLREAVDAVENDFDFLLIDCPPSLGVLTLNALTACGEVLIPLQAQFLALQGLGKLLNTVTLVRQRINPALRVSGVVLCMHEAVTKLSTEVVDDLSTFLESARGSNVPWSTARIFETRIRRNIKLAEASSFGQTVFEYAEKSNGSLDYALLAREVLDGDVRVNDAGPAKESASERRDVVRNEPARRESIQPASTSVGSISSEPARDERRATKGLVETASLPAARRNGVPSTRKERSVDANAGSNGKGSNAGDRKAGRCVVVARVSSEQAAAVPPLANATQEGGAPEIPIPPIEIPTASYDPISATAATPRLVKSIPPAPEANVMTPGAPSADSVTKRSRRPRRAIEQPVTPA